MIDARMQNPWLFAMMSSALILTSGSAHAQTTPPGSAQSGGIWKAAVPPKSMKGEFDSLDPIGLAAGARIKADCSLNWTSPDDGKLYCFSSGTSLEFFLDEPQASIKRARQGWLKLTADRR